MTQIACHSLLSLTEYQRQRALLCKRIIARRRERSLVPGPAMRLQFEDEATVRHLVQEALHIERVADPLQVQQQIDTFAHLLPQGNQWKATLLIELPDAAQRSRDIAVLSEAAHQLYVQCRGFARVPVHANEDLADRHRSRPTAVHFLRFEPSRTLCAALYGGGGASVGCAHPGYAWQRRLAPPLLRQLVGDLSPAEQQAAPLPMQHSLRTA
jgi:hypothetical protein